MEEAIKHTDLKVAKKLSSKKIKETIFETHTEELIIGLCGPMGTDIHFIAKRLTNILEERYKYKCIIIKLSDLIKEQKNLKHIKSASSFDDYDQLINGGNELRKKYGSTILSELAVNEIAVNREENKRKFPEEDYKSERVCYIIDSIKHKEELNFFRLIYTDIFYFFGVFSPVKKRIQNLKDKNLKHEEIYKLIDRDSGEELKHGQKVTDTFAESDFFLRVENNLPKKIDKKLQRYLNLIFDANIETPTEEESAMYAAFSAAGNSACLSRQVGSCVTDHKGEILSTGWNDVPKFGGGVYQSVNSNEDNDLRCMNIKEGICFNDREKQTIVEALSNLLVEEKIIGSDEKGKVLAILRQSRIKELIEFSRAVHAEMLSLILASQKAGNRIIGGKLYCTTYPCHNCARHIVASGISIVYYIEPYRKSLATKLHYDSITEDENELSKLRVLMFDGVAPRRYLDFFRMKSKRKQDGVKISERPDNIKPKKTLSLRAIWMLEAEVTNSLKTKDLLKD